MKSRVIFSSRRGCARPTTRNNNPNVGMADRGKFCRSAQ